MATVLDIIKQARRILNIDQVGDTVSAEEATEGKSILNDILEDFNLQKFAPVSMQTVSGTLAAQAAHTIGTGGNIDVDRPVKIERAYTRDEDVDFNIEQISAERYAEISIKGVSSTYPEFFYYESSYPLGTIYVYPYPAAALTVYLLVWSQFTAFADTTEDVELAPGYKNVLAHELALLLGPRFGKTSMVQKGGVVFDQAAKFRSNLKAANVEVKSSRLDGLLMNTPGVNSFNIYRGF